MISKWKFWTWPSKIKELLNLVDLLRREKSFLETTVTSITNVVKSQNRTIYLLQKRLANLLEHKGFSVITLPDDRITVLEEQDV